MRGSLGGAPGIEHPSAGAAVAAVMKLPAIDRADTIITIQTQRIPEAQGIRR